MCLPAGVARLLSTWSRLLYSVQKREWDSLAKVGPAMARLTGPVLPAMSFHNFTHFLYKWIEGWALFNKNGSVTVIWCKYLAFLRDDYVRVYWYCNTDVIFIICCKGCCRCWSVPYKNNLAFRLKARQGIQNYTNNSIPTSLSSGTVQCCFQNVNSMHSLKKDNMNAITRCILWENVLYTCV